MHITLTKKEYSELGGMRNPRLFRKQKGKGWSYHCDGSMEDAKRWADYAKYVDNVMKRGTTRDLFKDE